MPDVPANTLTKAQLDPSAFGGTYSGALDFAGDHDWVAVLVGGGQTYHFYLSFLETGSLIAGDSTLTIRDAFGNPVASIDDGGVGLNSRITFVAPPGLNLFYLDIGEFGDNATGTYSIFGTSLPATDHLLTDAADPYTGLAGERIVGGKGNDTIWFGAALDALGEQGDDVMFGNALNNYIVGGLGNDTAFGGVGVDTMFGDAGNDHLYGDANDDYIRGGGGNDIVNGGSESDTLIGGRGKDYLTGGTEADSFVFASTKESPRGAGRDVIVDFSRVQGDVIDLGLVTAIKGTDLTSAFHYIGRQDFRHHAGELHYIEKAAFLLVEGDTNGDGRADFQIEVHGPHLLSVGDFIL